MNYQESKWIPKPEGGWERAKKNIHDELKETVAKQSESESEPEIKKSVLEQNIEILNAQGENGKNLAVWYSRAVELYPELKEVLIAQRPEGDVGAFSSSKFSENNQTGRHKVVLDLTPDSEHRYMEDFDHRQESLRLIAERLRIPKESLNRNLFQVWILLHELGHVLDYIHTDSSPKKREESRAHEMKTLPIANGRIERLRIPEVKAYLLENFPNLFEDLTKKYKSKITDFPGGIIDDYEDVIRLQEREYKSLATEVYADDFATSILLNTNFDHRKTP